MKQVQKHLWMVWPCQSSSLGTSMPLMRTTWLRVGTSFLNLSALCASQLLAASSVWKRCWIHLFHASINPYGIRVSSIKEGNVKLQHCHDKNQWWRQLRRSVMSIFASIAESKASSGNKKHQCLQHSLKLKERMQSCNTRPQQRTRLVFHPHKYRLCNWKEKQRPSIKKIKIQVSVI